MYYEDLRDPGDLPEDDEKTVLLRPFIFMRFNQNKIFGDSLCKKFKIDNYLALPRSDDTK